jgi:acyl carrier protein
MSESNLVAEVAETVRLAAKIAPHVPIGAESRLVEDLAIDSLDLVGVFLKVQDRFDVMIDDNDVSRLLTVADLAAYVDQQRGAAAPARGAEAA